MRMAFDVEYVFRHEDEALRAEWLVTAAEKLRPVLDEMTRECGRDNAKQIVYGSALTFLLREFFIDGRPKHRLLERIDAIEELVSAGL